MNVRELIHLLTQMEPDRLVVVNAPFQGFTEVNALVCSSLGGLDHRYSTDKVDVVELANGDVRHMQALGLDVAAVEVDEKGVLETRLVFDKGGKTILWPHDPKRSAGYLPDSHSLWEFLWNNREQLGGVAHTHPWNGQAWASHTDVTTFSAIERGLGKRLLWPIVTFTDMKVFEWVGPGLYDYAPLRNPAIVVEDVTDLRQKSRMAG